MKEKPEYMAETKKKRKSAGGKSLTRFDRKAFWSFDSGISN